MRHNKYFSGIFSVLYREVARELCKVCCNVYFPYKSPRLGEYLEGKDIQLLTTLGELEEKILHFFVWVLLYKITFRIFFYDMLFPPIVVG